MPTVLSVTMAVGARLLARKQAIVTRLAAIEELAGIDVLCSDKTGTLTQNKLTLGEPFGARPRMARRPATHSVPPRWPRAPKTRTPSTWPCSARREGPTTRCGYQVIHSSPFDPVHKRTEATVSDGRTARSG